MAEQYDGFISYSHAADDLLAPRLQSGLQRFAKPWWRRRAVRMFRDESSLSANPHLWSSITDALDGSEWFVLLLSEDAASSEWVNREVEYWLANKPADRILPVVTDGEFSWAEGDVSGSAAPEALSGAFGEEPRWVDLRWARTDEHLDLSNPRFSDAVADVASALRGIPKDELASEEVRQHRRTIRTAWVAGVVVLLLGIAATVGALVARDERNRARARALGASAVAALEAQSDPQLAKLLALEAIRASGSVDDQPKAVVDTLFTALTEDRLVRTIDSGFDGYTAIDLSRDDRRLAVVSESGAAVLMYDVPSGGLVWSATPEPDTSDRFVGVHIHPSSTLLAVSVEDSQGAVRQAEPDNRPNRILILDAATGDLVQILGYPDCTDGQFLGSAQVLGSGWSPDGSLFAVTNGWSKCSREGALDGFWVEILDARTFETVAVIPSEDPVATWAFFEPDNDLLVRGLFTGTHRYLAPAFDRSDWETDVAFGAVSRDGSVMSSVDNLADPTRHSLIKTETGNRFDKVVAPAYPALPGGLAFSPDGSRFIIQTEGNQTLIWDVATGEQLFELQTGRGGNPVITSDGKTLYTSHVDGTVKVWDLAVRSVGRAEVAALPPGMAANGNHFTIGPSLGATEILDAEAPGDPDGAKVIFFDLATGHLRGDPVPGSGVFALGDGRFLVMYWTEAQPDRYQPSRGAVIYDPETAQTTPFYGCMSLDPDSCIGDDPPVWLSVSADGTEIMIREQAEPERWRVVDVDGVPTDSGVSPWTWSWVSAFTSEWIIGYDEDEVAYAAVDRTTGELIFSIPVCGCREEVSPGGRYLVAADGGRITIVTLGTWETTVVETKAGHVRGMAFNEDQTLLALGDDRSVHIIDVDASEVVQSMPVGGVSDFHWLDDETLLIATSDGLWSTISLNVRTLIDLALDNPGRGFTERECSVYGIGSCPTTVDAVRERYRSLGLAS